MVFDDVIEHLESSINCIRNNVDYISCVYQHISYYGTIGRESNYEILNDLFKRGLIDKLIYRNDNLVLNSHDNKLFNRNLGLDDALSNGCEYFLAMDGDEYYIPTEFKNIKEMIIDNNFESSACQMITYYKYLNLILDPPEDYYCPFIHKINTNYKFGITVEYPVGVSLDRVYHSNNFLKLDRKQIQMHHMSSVRRDLKLKLENHGCTPQFKKEIDYLVNYYDNYQYPERALFQAKPYKWYDVKKTECLFTNSYFSKI